MHQNPYCTLPQEQWTQQTNKPSIVFSFRLGRSLSPRTRTPAALYCKGSGQSKRTNRPECLVSDLVVVSLHASDPAVLCCKNSGHSKRTNRPVCLVSDLVVVSLHASDPAVLCCKSSGHSIQTNRPVCLVSDLAVACISLHPAVGSCGCRN